MDVEKAMGRRTRTMTIVSFTLWVVVVGVWFVFLGLEHAHGCPGRSQPSGPLYAHHWRWWPPGNQCIYKAPGGVYVLSRPSAALEAVFGLLIVWPVSTIAIARASATDRRRRDSTVDTAQAIGHG